MPESDRRHVDDPSEAPPEPAEPADERDEAPSEDLVEATDEPGAVETASEPRPVEQADEHDEMTSESDPVEAEDEPEPVGATSEPEPVERGEAPDEAPSESGPDEASTETEPGGAADEPKSVEATSAPEAVECADEQDAEHDEATDEPEPDGTTDEPEPVPVTPEQDPVEVPDTPADEDEDEHEPEGRPRTGRLLRRLTAALVALLLVAGVAAYAFDLGPRWLGWDYTLPGERPAAVAPPPGLRLPAARPPEAVAAPVADHGADPAAVRRALAAVVADKKLGTGAAVRVAELRGPHAGTEVYAHGPALVTPASTLKLLTTTAALAALGPDHRFTTKVVAGPGARTLTLVGGGDPLLARKPDAPGAYPQRADVTTLARQTAQALKAEGRTQVRLLYDSSLFTGPAVSPHWEPTYVSQNVVSPISALWVDEGRDARGLGYRSADPAAAAADAFAQALRKQGVKVVGKPVARAAEPSETTLTEVQGAPLSQVVQYVLETSDNEGAEVLARQTALATGRPASFLGGAAAVREQLRRLGVPLDGVTTYDGSGLSRHDRVRPSTLLDVLETDAAKNHPGLRTVVTGLPVAGFTGSLALRFQRAPKSALGVVRAKTGTLTGVHALAGTVLTRDGTLLAFVAVADQVKLPDTLAARDDLDKIAAALAGCACGATP